MRAGSFVALTKKRARARLGVVAVLLAVHQRLVEVKDQGEASAWLQSPSIQGDKTFANVARLVN